MVSKSINFFLKLWLLMILLVMLIVFVAKIGLALSQITQHARDYIVNDPDIKNQLGTPVKTDFFVSGFNDEARNKVVYGITAKGPKGRTNVYLELGLDNTCNCWKVDTISFSSVRK